MSKHPANLFLRFFLELFALGAFGVWGWNQGEGWWRFLFGFGLPILAAVAWGVFAVKDDPTRSGKTVVETPGFLRLLLELAFFGFALWCVFDLDYPITASVFGGVLVLHYALSFNRIHWLLAKN